MSEVNDQEWHLDKKVPLALALMIIIQTLTLVYVGTTWKDSIDHRLDTLETKEVVASPQINSARIQNNSDRLLSLETKFNYIQETLKRIDEKLDKNQIK